MDRETVIDRAVEIFMDGARTQSPTAIDEMISYLMSNHSLNSYSLLSLLSSLFSSLSLSMGGKNENDSQSSNAYENSPPQRDLYSCLLDRYEELKKLGYSREESIDIVCEESELLGHQIYELCLKID